MALSLQDLGSDKSDKDLHSRLVEVEGQWDVREKCVHQLIPEFLLKCLLYSAPTNDPNMDPPSEQMIKHCPRRYRTTGCEK